ncbi:MAG TPA: dihydrodipicolinate synthase family protein, partial [Candidatus Hydrogenedentes bacterium]|nr:dihydrodipicolinate synthase family protein [Candidatus Hydrogenedentota bacterium]
KSSVLLVKEAEKIGVAAVGAVPPFYYKHSDDAVVGYYKEIIEAVNIPVYAYNNPETSRFTFTFKTVQRLQKLGLAGLKDSPLNIGFVSRVAYDAQVNNKDFQVIIGTSTGWLPLYYMGVRATIAGMNNWAPEIMTALVKWTLAGDEAKAQKAYLVMMDVSARLHFTDSTIASHMALYARGFDAGYPRKPMVLPPFSDPKYREIRGVIEAAFESLGLEFTTGSHDVVQ